jgi:class 3 adenylate cyclase
MKKPSRAGGKPAKARPRMGETPNLAARLQAAAAPATIAIGATLGTTMSRKGIAARQPP